MHLHASRPVVKQAPRWTIVVTLTLTAIVAVLAGAFLRLVPNDEELASRIAAAAEQNLGVKVTVGAAHLRLWPQPEFVLTDVATVQPQPIVLKRVIARPHLRELLDNRLSFRHAEIDGAVIPLLALRGLHVNPAAPRASVPVPVPLERLDFRHLTWITRFGKELEFDGSALFDVGWQPREAELVRPGVQPEFRLTLEQQDPDHWRVRSQLGGGTADGQVALSRGNDGHLQLSGHLAPTNVEVAGALDSFKSHSAVRGKASGKTELSASGENVVQLAGSMHTRTIFSMDSATLLHIDVDKAIRSFGKDFAGETKLRGLTGQMDTQNTPDGLEVRYSGLQAKGDTFTAKGEGTVANRRVDGELTVDLVGGLVGVPLRVSGPLGHAHVTVQKTEVAGEAAGAVVGTAVLPGIGTAVGAAIGKMLGAGAAKKK
jgi:uncharacterized protein involved in outer membrane biogenesis